MNLQEFLVAKFTSWSPPEPEVLKRTKYSISLAWGNVEPFHFIADQLLYRLEKNDKIPPWTVVYRGGKTLKEIDNLASRNCHKFRLKVILKADAVATLAERALQFYGDEATVYDNMEVLEQQKNDNNTDDNQHKNDGSGAGDAADTGSQHTDASNKESGPDQNETKETRSVSVSSGGHKWLESRWSALTWGSTDTDGTSAVCFCMAVRCGYIKQVQGMLDERPALIGIINSSNGFTPLATAVRKGDMNTVRFLMLAGAELEQRSASGQTALHLAVLGARVPIVQLLLDQGADFQVLKYYNTP